MKIFTLLLLVFLPVVAAADELAESPLGELAESPLGELVEPPLGELVEPPLGEPVEPPLGELAYKTFTLPNGLQVVLHQDKSAPVVVVDVAYHVGSKNETAGRTGFAHLFEHLMFDGSTNVPRGAFDQYTTRAGGSNNAFTTFDWTNYYIILPSHQLEMGLWLESDRLLQFAARDISLQTQREVVKEERRQSYDNQPYGTANELIVEALFKASGYNHSVIGRMDDLNKATLSDVKSFYEDFYAPDNAVLVIAGDIDYGAAEQLVKKYFADIPKSKKPVDRRVKAESPLAAEQRKSVPDNVELPAVFFGWRMPPDGTAEARALELLSVILTTGKSSRLYKSLVYEQRLVQDISSYTEVLEQAGIFTLDAIASEGKTAEQVERGVWQALNDVIKNGVSERELEKAKNRVLVSKYRTFETVQGKATQLAYYATLRGDVSLINTETALYEAVTKESIQQAAATFLRQGNAVVATYLPKAQ